MEITLYTWQEKFLDFVSMNENTIINLYGYPYGKSFIATYDSCENHRYYHDDGNHVSMFDFYGIENDLARGDTVIIISIEKITDIKFPILYFEVNHDDNIFK